MNNAMYGMGLPVYDYCTRCGTYASYLARGMAFDGLHPGELGYWDWGSGVATALAML